MRWLHSSDKGLGLATALCQVRSTDFGSDTVSSTLGLSASGVVSLALPLSATFLTPRPTAAPFHVVWVGCGNGLEVCYLFLNFGLTSGRAIVIDAYEESGCGIYSERSLAAGSVAVCCVRLHEGECRQSCVTRGGSLDGAPEAGPRYTTPAPWRRSRRDTATGCGPRLEYYNHTVPSLPLPSWHRRRGFLPRVPGLVGGLSPPGAVHGACVSTRGVDQQREIVRVGRLDFLSFFRSAIPWREAVRGPLYSRCAGWSRASRVVVSQGGPRSGPAEGRTPPRWGAGGYLSTSKMLRVVHRISHSLLSHNRSVVGVPIRRRGHRAPGRAAA